MKPWRIAVFGAVLSLFSPTPGQAQDPDRWTWDITPHLGYHNSAGDVGGVAPVNPYRFLDLRELGPAASFGLRADLTLPIRGLSLTLRGLATFPSDAAGKMDCSPGLICLTQYVPSDTETQVVSGLVGLTFHPWDRAGRFEPFITGGVGLKQAWVRWEEEEQWDIVAGDRSLSSGALLMGVGIDLHLAGMPLRFEVADVWTPKGKELGNPFGPSLSSARPPRPASRHDVNISVGWILDLR